MALYALYPGRLSISKKCACGSGGVKDRSANCAKMTRKRFSPVEMVPDGAAIVCTMTDSRRMAALIMAACGGLSVTRSVENWDSADSMARDVVMSLFPSMPKVA